MNGDDIGKADSFFTQLEHFFAAHPIAKWMLLAWVFGWIAAFILRPFIRMSPLPDKLERHLVVLACVVASGLAAARMWDGEYVGIVAVILGGTSPFAYLGLAKLLCWKFPSLTPHLSLSKDFSAAIDDEAAEPAPTPKDPAP